MKTFLDLHERMRKHHLRRAAQSKDPHTRGYHLLLAASIHKPEAIVRQEFETDWHSARARWCARMRTATYANR